MNDAANSDLPGPPSKWLLLLEGRALAEYASLLLSWPLLHTLPRGDGHPVMIIPGFGATDISTRPLRRVLQRLGYSVYGWEQGRNLGMKTKIREGLRASLPRLHAKHGAKVSLIGWSLGGVFVREIARHQPELVRRVITLGSPINLRPDATNVDAMFRRLNPGYTPDLEAFKRRCLAPPVPCTAVYSKSDGIVAWRTSMENPAPNTENVEVSGSHFGLGCNPQVIRVIAERLARPVQESRSSDSA